MPQPPFVEETPTKEKGAPRQQRASTIPADNKHYKGSFVLQFEQNTNATYTYDPPFTLYFETINNSRAEKPNVEKLVSLNTVEELKEYMSSYPRAAFAPCEQSRKRPMAAVEKTTPSKKTSTGDENKDTVHDLVKQGTTNSEGKDRHDNWPDGTEFKITSTSWQRSVVSVAFCDKERSPKDSFRIGDEVYALLTFQNPADKTIYICMDFETFRRQGIQVLINGMEKLAVQSHYGLHDHAVVALLAGESYTFFRCVCRGTSAKIAKNDRFRYAAPTLAGQTM